MPTPYDWLQMLRTRGQQSPFEPAPPMSAPAPVPVSGPQPAPTPAPAVGPHPGPFGAMVSGLAQQGGIGAGGVPGALGASPTMPKPMPMPPTGGGMAPPTLNKPPIKKPPSVKR